MTKIFIANSYADSEIAERLAIELRARGNYVLFNYGKAKKEGDQEEAIEIADLVILINAINGPIGNRPAFQTSLALDLYKPVIQIRRENSKHENVPEHFKKLVAFELKDGIPSIAKEIDEYFIFEDIPRDKSYNSSAELLYISPAYKNTGILLTSIFALAVTYLITFIDRSTDTNFTPTINDASVPINSYHISFDMMAIIVLILVGLNMLRGRLS